MFGSGRESGSRRGLSPIVGLTVTTELQTVRGCRRSRQGLPVPEGLLPDVTV
jgi:hypothetical protein